MPEQLIIQYADAFGKAAEHVGFVMVTVVYVYHMVKTEIMRRDALEQHMQRVHHKAVKK